MAVSGAARARWESMSINLDKEDQGLSETLSAPSVHGFSDAVLRRGFVRKVYGILAAQLLLTFGMCVGSTLSPFSTEARGGLDGGKTVHWDRCRGAMRWWAGNGAQAGRDRR